MSFLTDRLQRERESVKFTLVVRKWPLSSVSFAVVKKKRKFCHLNECIVSECHRLRYRGGVTPLEKGDEDTNGW